VIHAQLLDELWRLAVARGAFDDPRLAPRLAQAFVEVRIFQLHNWRSISRTAAGGEPGPVGAINKLWWSEMSKRLHDTAMAVVGSAAPLWRGAHDNPGDGAWQRSWLYYQASSIWAGTNEIQRNVIAERTLGLPREIR
jgi:alkylation response protein AidB-like acyl-CoA dehydrogenase